MKQLQGETLHLGEYLYNEYATPEKAGALDTLVKSTKTGRRLGALSKEVMSAEINRTWAEDNLAFKDKNGIAKVTTQGKDAFAFHLPLDFRSRHVNQLHLSQFTAHDGTPLITVAKRIWPPRIVITAHTADGYHLGSDIQRKLRGIAQELKKRSPTLAGVKIDLVRGAKFKIRESTHLREELKHVRQMRDNAENNLAILRGMRLPALMQRIDQAKVELADKTLAKNEALRDRLRQIERVARAAGLGTRGKALAAIASAAKKATTITKD